MWQAIIGAVSGIVSSVSSTIDKSNLYYTQRQSSAVTGRTSTSAIRNLVLVVVAVAVVIIFVKLSKSE